MTPTEQWMREQAEDERRRTEAAMDRLRDEAERRWDDRVWAGEHEVGRLTERATDASRDVMWAGGGVGIGLAVQQVWKPSERWEALQFLTLEHELLLVLAVMFFLGGRALLRHREASDAQARLSRLIAERPR